MNITDSLLRSLLARNGLPPDNAAAGEGQRQTSCVHHAATRIECWGSTSGWSASEPAAVLLGV
jgi:hypothetical protein